MILLNRLILLYKRSNRSSFQRSSRSSLLFLSASISPISKEDMHSSSLASSKVSCNSPSRSNQPMEIDSDTSDMSSQCESDNSDFSDTASASSIELNPPALLPLHNNGDVSSSRSRHSANRPRILDGLPEFSDDPDDETDEDIANVPLDYGQSDQTKTRRQRIEHRWHK